MITVTANLTPEKFLETAGPWLEQKEDQNNVILGIAGNIASKPAAERQEHYFWVVKNGKELMGAAVWTPPFKLTLTDMPAEALAPLAKKAKKSFPGIPGVQGPQQVLPTFIRAWNIPGLQAELEVSSRIYRLEKVELVPPVSGVLRQAEPRDLDLLTQWCVLFRQEIHEPEKINEKVLVEGYIREGRLFVWEHGVPMAMAGFAGITANGARINMVYAPPAYRKRGYASNLVASLSQRLLNSGRKFCTLYTDLLNPTSNHIYQKIGYKPVCDWDGYSFQEFKSL